MMKTKTASEKQLEVLAFSEEYRPTLLIVDDEESIRTSLTAVLRFCRPEFHLGVASSAEEALSILENTEVDLLITDLKLPKMDGLSLVDVVLTKYPETRSILMTAYGDNFVDYGAYQNGCACYLEKPFDVDKLLSAIDETLEQIKNRQLVHAESLIEQIYTAAEEKIDVSIKISDGTNSGLLVLKEQLITYADFGSLVGISALVAMLNCRSPQLTCREDAPELSNADLPVSWRALLKAAFLQSTTKQIAALRKSGRDLCSEPSDEYPSEESEVLIQKEILTELLQRLREAKLDSELDGEVKRKRLPFHQSLATDMIERQVTLRRLVNTGIEEYSTKNFIKARSYWIEALEIDPNCQQAKHNLAILNK